MIILMRLRFILQLCVISVAPAYASQNIALPTTEASNKAATDALLEVVQKKETTSDDIIALINKGADLNAQDQSGWTPLIWAASNGLKDICITLIDEGAEINANDRDSYGYTPLHSAAIYGNPNLASLLLRNSADVDVRHNNDRSTPLHLAAKWGRADVAAILLRNGAEVYDKNIDEATPLLLATMNDHVDVAALILGSMIKQRLLQEQNPSDCKARLITFALCLLRLGLRFGLNNDLRCYILYWLEEDRLCLILKNGAALTNTDEERLVELIKRQDLTLVKNAMLIPEKMLFLMI